MPVRDKYLTVRDYGVGFDILNPGVFTGAIKSTLG